jgi:exopolysaccharide production protein ExoQ
MSQGVHSRISQPNHVRGYDTRHSRALSRTPLSGSKAMIDKFAMVPISACLFALVVFPLLIFFTFNEPQSLEGRPETRIFWPAMAAISALLTVQNRSRLTLPPNIICLLAYLAFAGASVLWAFSPERSFIRYLQEVMIVTSIVLPAMLAARTADMMRALFLCFALALILNLLFVFQGSSTIVMNGSKLEDIGYQGYFIGKNYLGECAAVAFLLSINEIICRGWRRRLLGIVVLVLSFLLVYLSKSKTAFALAFICPFLAALTLTVRRRTRVSVAVILLCIPLCFELLASVSNLSFERLSYILYGDSTLTGRTIIWDFVNYEIGRSPLVGWGYQSFWFVPNSPSFEAPGWVKTMPNAHNGYIDTKLEMGYVGLVFLEIFIVATLHAIGRVADRDPTRARLLLSLVLFIVLYNFFESLWMRGFEFLWVVFVIVAAEAGRYWRPFPVGGAASGSKSQRPGSPGPSPSARIPRLRMGLS